MICAGNGDNPLECGQEAITVIAGFAACQKHAQELANTWKLKKMMQEQAKKIPPPFTWGHPTDQLKVPLKGGAWKNVKHKY